jgi:hypothetical protein
MTVAAIAAGTGTAGGLTAVVAKKIHDRRAPKTNKTQTPNNDSDTKEPIR